MPRPTALATLASLAVIAGGIGPSALAAGAQHRLATVNGELAAYLYAHTKVPAPLLPFVLPRVNTAAPLYITANVTADANRYSVQYWAVPRRRPVNGPGPVTASPRATHVLTLTGMRYASDTAALHALDLAVLPWYQAPRGTALGVPLIPGFAANYYPGQHLLTWQEGKWTVEVNQGSETLDLKQGRQIIHALDTWALPPFPGVLVATPAPPEASGAPAGEGYALAFQDGVTVYRINPFYNRAPQSRYGLRVPFGVDSPATLVQAANSLVPISGFYRPSVRRIVVHATPATIYAGHHAMIVGRLLTATGAGAVNAPFSLLGLPQTPSYLNGTTNQNGYFSMRFFFPSPGTYTIQAGDGVVAGSVVVHVEPEPAAFPPVVSAALRAITGKTEIPLDGPGILPARSGGYLTARTEALPSTYVVFVMDTTRPLGVNSPAINRYLSPAPMVATFSSARLKARQLPVGAPYYLRDLARYNPLYVNRPASATSPMVFGNDVQGIAYGEGANTRIAWREGDWTVQVSGSTLAREKKAALPLIAYLNRYFLPPYPGILAVRLNESGTRAVTFIDWMNGHVLSYVNDPTASPTNPTETAAMATSWRAG